MKRLFLTVLVIVFLVETAVMLVLHALPLHLGWEVASIADSSILMPLVGVPLWWLIAQRERAEDELKRAETRYRSLFEHVPAGLYRTTPAGQILDANPAIIEMMGYPDREAYLSLRAADLYANLEDRRRWQELMEREGVVRAFEAPARHRDGKIIWIRDNARAVRDASGQMLFYEGTWEDISDRKRAEEALRASEVRYRSLTENTFDLVLETSIDGRFTFASPSYRDVLGYEPDELLGTSIFDLVHPEDRPAVMEEFTRAVSTGSPGAAVYRSQRKDGEWLWMESAGKPFQSDAGEIRAVIVSRDITPRKQAEETITRMAYQDALTGLPNRALFEDRFSVALAQARRKGETLCLMSVDVDRFKLVNDTLGHAAGDAVLKAAGERLRGLVRRGDTVARIGGDEFVLLLPGNISTANASRVATDIRNAFRKPFHLDGQEVHATISIGVSFYPQDGETADALIRNADAALYRAKEAGRSNYQLYTPSMNIGAAERLALDQELRHALEHEEFDIYYQPQVAINTGRVVGAEALLRWRHPSRGVVPPDEFIPLAEETGLIVPLGEWVLRTVAAQVQTWLAAGLQPLRVAVNISMRQFQEPGFVQTVAQVLQDTGLDAAHLELEITESTAMRDAAFTISVLRQLREMGIRISIDDFGTGHSSLRYLRDFPIHALKIDRSFVRDLTTDPNDAALVSEIIALGHRLGLEIVAEGVETQQQLNFLRDGGCDLFQGYLCAKPMPSDAFEESLKSGASPCAELWLQPRSKNGARPARVARLTAGTRRRR